VRTDCRATFHPKTKRPKLFRVGTFAEQPSPEVCSLKIMPTMAIERLFKIAHYPNIFASSVGLVMVDRAEYVSWLEEIAAKVVDWSDQREVCILASSADLSDELADHAKVAVPCLLQRLKSVPHPYRGDVVAMKVQALAKGRNELDPTTI
jgi:hypothetical protein